MLMLDVGRHEKDQKKLKTIFWGVEASTKVRYLHHIIINGEANFAHGPKIHARLKGLKV